MKTRNILFLAIAVILLTTSGSCNFIPGVKPSKNYITRDFKISDFDKLDLATIADVYYTQSTDSSTSLQIYGSDNLVELVNVDVKDNTLFLNMKKKNIKKADLKINIVSPSLQRIKLRGVGNFHIEGKIEATGLIIRNEGVGNIKINDISCRELDLRAEGVGNIHIRGKAEKANLVSHGVGNIDAANLESKSVTATSSGVGNISCHATQSIDAKVDGIGNISYKGNPADKRLKKSGIGSIKQK
ncbi:MAG: DUF2807 domain-containing protein [Mediterranea sp.]|jgi:hypothetical protein|nr:DUF2807 domain-containing protein [Mediterranea sp.]